MNHSLIKAYLVCAKGGQLQGHGQQQGLAVTLVTLTMRYWISFNAHNQLHG
jgi:hypothetical protein